ncbi:MAG: hypothetical protein UY18_C0002G0001, partial [Microgenomates group bacterium GW2011_GWF2_47_9]
FLEEVQLFIGFFGGFSFGHTPNSPLFIIIYLTIGEMGTACQ